MRQPIKLRWGVVKYPPVPCPVEAKPRRKRKSCIYPSDSRIPRFISELARERPSWVLDAPRVTCVRAGQATEVARLEEATNAGDERAFVNTLRGIRWEQARPDDFVRAINLAIKLGLPRAARHIANEGVKHYPDEVGIQEYANLFAPAKVLPNNGRSSSNQDANIAWLKAHGRNYKGKWVALKDGQLLGAEDRLKDLIQKVGDVTDVMLTPSY